MVKNQAARNWRTLIYHPQRLCLLQAELIPSFSAFGVSQFPSLERLFPLLPFPPSFLLSLLLLFGGKGELFESRVPGLAGEPGASKLLVSLLGAHIPSSPKRAWLSRPYPLQKALGGLNGVRDVKVLSKALTGKGLFLSKLSLSGSPGISKLLVNVHCSHCISCPRLFTLQALR